MTYSQAVKLIKEKSVVSLSDLQVVFPDTNRRTLYRDLQALVDKGILNIYGTFGTCFGHHDVPKKSRMSLKVRALRT
jgi:DeoR/GlpR family transcriptional regulator of sugar metabolism